MNYDFIEIGTSNFSTLIQEATDSTVGISVEPIKYYLDQLPNRALVKKLNCGIAFDNVETDMVIHYIPESVIEANNLAWWIKGCNSTNDYHNIHKTENLYHLVEKATVSAVPISKLFIENNVEELEYLKIDTEGGDADILLHLLVYLMGKPVKYYPKKIKFESNQLTPVDKINDVISKYKFFGYKLTHRDENDSTLEFK